MKSLLQRNYLIAISLCFCAGCLPLNNLTTSTSTAVTGTNNPWASGSTGSSSSSSQCAQIDSSNPERAICDNCTAAILAENCPGASSVSGCSDSTFQSIFSSRVNQCITASMSYGALCYKACSGGTVLTTRTCTCEFPSSGSSSGSTGQIDTGLVNYGPPVVNIVWPPAFDAITAVNKNSCSASSSILEFLVQNRGDTVPSLNQYSQVHRECKVTVWDGSLATPATVWQGISSSYTNLSGAGTPAYTASARKVLSSLAVQTAGINSGIVGAWPNTDERWLSQLMAYTDFNGGAPAFVTLAGGASYIPYNSSTNPNFGYYINGTADTAKLTLTLNETTLGYAAPPVAVKDYRVPANGQYLLSLDFYALDGWIGGGFGNYSPVLNSEVYSVVPAASFALGSGGSHTCSSNVSAGNQISCWGKNSFGQLGDNTLTDNLPSATAIPPIPPATVSGFPALVPLAIGGGDYHTCAIATGGTLYCWGLNANGQLGVGDNADRKVATALAAANVLSVSAGANHTCASVNGTFNCWGNNSYGQLGTGSTTSTNTPAAVSGPLTGTYISAGANHTCATDAGAQVRCWGDNSYGQLGNGTTGTSYSPVAATNVTAASLVAVGLYHSCALSSGTVKCWGLNTSGQLGNNTTTNSSTAVNAVGLSGITMLTAGANHTCASDGSRILCWGSNGNGQLGNSTFNSVLTPVEVVGLPNIAGSIKSLSAGMNHTCAVINDGSGNAVQCWGFNVYYQLGAASSGTHFKVAYNSASTDCTGTSPNKPCAQLPDGTYTTIFDQTFSNISTLAQSYQSTATFGPTQDLGGRTTAKDSVYRLNILFNHVCDPATAGKCDLILDIMGTNMTAARSWGVSHLSVQRVPTCGVAYSFTDSKQQSSTYCMRFNIFNSCGFTYGMWNGSTSIPGDEACSCWGRPSSQPRIPFLDTILTPTEALTQCPGSPSID